MALRTDGPSFQRKISLAGRWVGIRIPFRSGMGALVAHGPVAHAFYDGPFNNHDFKNFELMVDVMAAPNSNGGVYFHTEFQDSGFPKKGFRYR